MAIVLVFRDRWTVSVWSFRSFAIVAIAGVKPDLIPEIVGAGIVVIVGVVGASCVSIWSLWPPTDFLAVVAVMTIKWTPGLIQIAVPRNSLTCESPVFLGAGFSSPC